MRSILTLSLPSTILTRLKQKAKRAGMSVSAYVRRLIEYEESLISEEELVARCKEAEENYKKGNVKVLKSFDDLDKKCK